MKTFRKLEARPTTRKGVGISKQHGKFAYLESVDFHGQSAMHLWQTPAGRRISAHTDAKGKASISELPPKRTFYALRTVWEGTFTELPGILAYRYGIDFAAVTLVWKVN
jgi:hypothetical protein